MKRLSKLMMVCFMAAVMMLSVSCKQDDIAPVFIPKGVLPGLFSVSATKQVHFSQGNLQYQASTDTWRFAEHQWDHVGTQTPDEDGYYGGTVEGSDNRHISSTYNGWIDLFGWGTSGWNNGAVCYQPWSTGFWERDYSNNVMTGAYVESDWAWHNAISNGGNAAHHWRTPTAVEWQYLIAGRTDALSKRGTGNINGVGGLIILPDNWTLPLGCQFTSGEASDSTDWTLNSYTLAQWEKMEAAGAVFLPAAGYRVDSLFVDYVGCRGYYWLSDTDFNFRSDRILGYWWYTRYFGCSVRPVLDEE